MYCSYISKATPKQFTANGYNGAITTTTTTTTTTSYQWTQSTITQNCLFLTLIKVLYNIAMYICTVMHIRTCTCIHTSRLTIVSREAKKKQAVRDEQVSYLHIAPL